MPSEFIHFQCLSNISQMETVIPTTVKSYKSFVPFVARWLNMFETLKIFVQVLFVEIVQHLGSLVKFEILRVISHLLALKIYSDNFKLMISSFFVLFF